MVLQENYRNQSELITKMLIIDWLHASAANKRNALFDKNKSIAETKLFLNLFLNFNYHLFETKSLTSSDLIEPRIAEFKQQYAPDYTLLTPVASISISEDQRKNPKQSFGRVRLELVTHISFAIRAFHAILIGEPK